MPQCGSGPAKCDWKWSCARVLQNTRQHNPKLTCKTWPKLAPLTDPIFGHSGAPNQPFFRKKLHNFSKTTYSFGHIHVQNQALRWDQKMNLKPGPNSGTPLRKYIAIHQMWLKMVLLTGPILTPRANSILTLKRPSPLLKNKFSKLEKIIRKIAIFETSLPPLLAQTLTQGIELLSLPTDTREGLIF